MSHELGETCVISLMTRVTILMTKLYRQLMTHVFPCGILFHQFNETYVTLGYTCITTSLSTYTSMYHLVSHCHHLLTHLCHP